MKKNLCYLLAGLMILLFSTECKKKVIDRRNNYTGNWQFHYIVRSTSLGNPELITTGDYTGKISYDGRKDKKHIMHLELSKDWEEEFELDKNDELIQCEKRGRFDSEKSLTIVSTSAGCKTRIGGEISYTIEGSR